MLSIHLHNLTIFAHHGIYEEEKVLGNEFELNLTIQYQPARIPVKHLSETIDYVTVYELVKKRMAVPTALLETVITEIAKQILDQFPVAQEISIAIRKKYPPISRIDGSVGVSFVLNRKDL
jgi:dihydroneopterin aldolase